MPPETMEQGTEAQVWRFQTANEAAQFAGELDAEFWNVITKESFNSIFATHENGWKTWLVIGWNPV